MTEEFYSSIDLKKNQLTNVVIHTQNANTTSNVLLSEGQLIYNEDDDSLYTGNGFVNIKVGSTLSLNELQEPTENVSFGNVRITNLQTPTNPNDATTKEFVEALFSSNLAYDLANAIIYFSSNEIQQDDLTFEENQSLHDYVLAKTVGNKPNLFTNVEFTSNISKYSAILPTGLASHWYIFGNANTLITDYVSTPTINITAEPYLGIFGKEESYGTIKTYIQNSLQSNILTANLGNTTSFNDTVYTEAFVNLKSFTEVSNVWNQVELSTDLTFLRDGIHYIKLSSTVSGDTPNLKFYYDNFANVPTFQVSPNVTTVTENLKYLSNIPYLTTNTEFSVSFTGATGIFSKAYHPEAVANIYINSDVIDPIFINPNTTPSYTDNFPVSNVSVVLNKINKSTETSNGFIYVKLQKPDNKYGIETVNLNKKICTYGNVATEKIEYFFDESKRLLLNSDTLWDSETSFDSSAGGTDAQVRNGYLLYPVGADYSISPTGSKEYQRRFETEIPVSSGYLKIDGITQSDLSVYGTGSLNILLQLDTVSKYFDIGKDVCYTCSGDARGQSYPSKLDHNFGENIFGFTFGNFSTGLEPNYSYRIIIIFRDNSKSITRITHYNFSNEIDSY